MCITERPWGKLHCRKEHELFTWFQRELLFYLFFYVIINFKIDKTRAIKETKHEGKFVLRQKTNEFGDNRANEMKVENCRLRGSEKSFPIFCFFKCPLRIVHPFLMASTMESPHSEAIATTVQ